MKSPAYGFLKQAGRILNSGQARTLLWTGNIYDLFCLSKDGGEEYVPLISFLTESWSLPNLIVITYELNGPIRFLRDEDNEKVRDAWFQWRVGYDSNELAIKRMLAKGNAQVELDGVAKAYDDSLRAAISNPTLALELMRQMCLCSRTELGGKRSLEKNLL